MNNYQKVKVNISQDQSDKIKKAIQNGTAASIKLSHQDLNGEDVLALTKTQLNKMKKAYTDGTGVVLKMSKKQLKHNAKVEGGFIGALLPLLGMLGSTLATRVVPALATGLLAGVGSSAGSAMVDKIAGRGVEGIGPVNSKNPGVGVLRANTIYLRNRGQGMKMTAAGSGMFLRPWIKNDSVGGDGLYIRSGKGYESVGSVLLLGPNSPFASIPFLNLIL